MFRLPDGRVVQPDQQFELDDVLYLNGVRLMSEDERDALGIEDYEPPAEPPAPLPAPAPAQLQLWGWASCAIADQMVTTFDLGGHVAAATWWDTGVVVVDFDIDLPDTRYMALAYNGESNSLTIAEQDKFTNGLLISICDQAGAPVDPATLNLEIKRAT